MRPEVTKIIYFLVPDPSNTAILLLPSTDGWTLPVKEYKTRFLFVDEQQVCQDLLRIINQEQRNIPVVSFLYRAFKNDYADANGTTAVEVYVMETRSPIAFPEHAIWISQSNLNDDIELSPKLLVTREIVGNYLNSLSGNSITLRPPWRRPGWFQLMSEWTQAVLFRAYRCAKVTHISPVWNKSMAQVLLFETFQHGRFYFKATHPGIEEAKFTQWLSKLFPGRVPKVLEIDEQLNAMVMENFGKTHKEIRADDPDVFAAVFRSYGRMQIRAIELMKDPRNLTGLPKSKQCNPKLLASRINAVLDHEEVQKQLTKAELDDFRKQAPIWMKMCGQLENSKIPSSIVHRDLWLKNFAISLESKEEFLFFDWTLGCVTHPFIGLHGFRSRMGTIGVTEAHIESYLSLWKLFEPDMGTLKRTEILASIVRHILAAVGVVELALNCETVEQKFYVTLDRINRNGCFENAARSLRILRSLVAQHKDLHCFE